MGISLERETRVQAASSSAMVYGRTGSSEDEVEEEVETRVDSSSFSDFCESSEISIRYT